MSYIEMPVAEYQRRLAALPGARRPDGAHPATPRPVAAATDDDVRAARIRHPEAFLALDEEAALPGSEVAEIERLIAAAIIAVHGSLD